MARWTGIASRVLYQPKARMCKDVPAAAFQKLPESLSATAKSARKD